MTDYNEDYADVGGFGGRPPKAGWQDGHGLRGLQPPSDPTIQGDLVSGHGRRYVIGKQPRPIVIYHQERKKKPTTSPTFVCPIIDLSLDLSGLLIDCPCNVSANFPTGFSVVVSGNIDGTYTLSYTGGGISSVTLPAAVQIDHYDTCGGTLLDTVLADVEIQALCPGIGGDGAFDLVAFTTGTYLVNLFAGNGTPSNPQTISNILSCGGGGNFGQAGAGTISW